jgi:hypothetical protein
MSSAMAEEKAKKAPKSDKATAKKAAAPAAAAAAPEGETCRVDKCKQPVRAKGYCRKHYMGWRRGKVGTKHRYNTCSKEGCRKPATVAGRCDEHKKGAAGGEAAPAAA